MTRWLSAVLAVAFVGPGCSHLAALEPGPQGTVKAAPEFSSMRVAVIMQPDWVPQSFHDSISYHFFTLTNVHPFLETAFRVSLRDGVAEVRFFDTPPTTPFDLYVYLEADLEMGIAVPMNRCRVRMGLTVQDASGRTQFARVAEQKETFWDYPDVPKACSQALSVAYQQLAPLAFQARWKGASR